VLPLLPDELEVVASSPEPELPPPPPDEFDETNPGVVGGVSPPVAHAETELAAAPPSKARV
jgi:hypothetical protein